MCELALILLLMVFYIAKNYDINREVEQDEDDPFPRKKHDESR